MAAFRTVTIAEADAGLRLDRWFRERFPDVGFGALQKLLRTGQIRVDGKRAKANARLEAGQEVRVPPQVQSREKTAKTKGSEGGVRATQEKARPAPRASEAEARALMDRVLYRDADMLVLDKPAGLAVQGGTGTHRHLDAMLDALRFDAAERPRLVHRLDRDTSGLLVLGRHRAAARALTGAFRTRDARKIYLAVTVGTPRPRRGRIDLALGKAGGRGHERMVGDAEDARHAATLYAVADAAGQRAALVALMPLTGRTHQLRAHMAAIGTPILGDGKYGGADAFIAGLDLERRLHLHAYVLEIPAPSGQVLRSRAPVPGHMMKAMRAFGFEIPDEIDVFPRD